MGNSAKFTHDPAYDETSQPTTPRAVAELASASKKFGDVHAARDLNLRIAEGEFLSFLGPSGCGKTTALRMIAGFETPTSGDVLIDGMAVNDKPAFERPVNMVFQNYALFPHLTVSQNISFGLRQRRPKPGTGELRQKVAKALETVRLSGYEERRIWEMSGGQQQRVALARAIINEPKLLLLDEPLAALDRKLRKEMQIELQDLQRSLGITFVLVTHDQEEALSLSDRICVMRGGRIVQIGTPQELYDQPNSRYVADFVGTSNFVEGRIASSDAGRVRFESDAGPILKGRANAELPASGKGCLSVRPEQIRMTREPEGESLPVTIQNRIFLGEHTEYLVRHEALGNIIVLAPRQAEQDASSFVVGAAAHITWGESAALVLKAD